MRDLKSDSLAELDSASSMNEILRQAQNDWGVHQNDGEATL